MNLTIMRLSSPASHDWVLLEFVVSEFATLSLQQFTNYRPGFPVPALVSTGLSTQSALLSGSGGPVCSPTSLSNLGGHSVSCVLPSLTHARDVAFSFLFF